MRISISESKLFSLALALVLSYALLLVPHEAWASSVSISVGGSGGGGGGTPTGISNVLCTVVGWFTGTIGKAIATLAIIVVGIGALMGKVSWGMAIIVGLGVGIVFGASNIVDVLGGSGSC